MQQFLMEIILKYNLDFFQNLLIIELVLIVQKQTSLILLNV